MKKNLILALVLCAAPVVAAPALTLKPDSHQKAVTVAGEYTIYDADFSDDSSYGITIKYDKVLAPMNHGNYWSWNAAFNYSSGTNDNGNPGGKSDYTTMALRFGIDANIVTSKKLTVFVGPRIGMQQVDPDAGDKEKALLYGFATGVRYITENGTNLEVGYHRNFYDFSEEAWGVKSSNSIYAGISIGF